MTSPQARTPAPLLRTTLAGDPSIPGTIAMTLVTLSVGLGFGRLFSAGSFAVPVIVTAALAHGVAWWCRRNSIPTGLAATATLGATAVATAWTVLGHTTAYGIPIPYTLRAAAEALVQARDLFEVVKAPTPVMPGFLIALCLAIGISAFMSDWAAFRLDTAVEALVPSFTLFIFTAALGTERMRIPAVVAYIAAALGFLVVSAVTTRTRLAWFGGRPDRGPSSLARGAAVIGGAAILVSLVVGPALPGYGSESIIKYKNRGRPGPSSRSTISPLVDIRGRLVERADIEVFTVATNQRAYWRLTSLDTFNGTIWSSKTNYRPTGGGLGTNERLTLGITSTETVQEFSIGALDSIWLPAAYRPLAASGIDGISYDSDTASLITDEETTDGSVYLVESAVPTYTPEQLDGATGRAPEEVVERNLALPDISRRVRELATSIVANHQTPYRRAKALQDFFHGGAFTYQLSEIQGHDSGALENFLFENRKGYCEQFAGAYAVMARAVGLPTRIAVGFTPGELQADGLFHVRDEHAHAWPEVYLDGFGWVQFEPTVGRGAPNTQAYTGLPEQQDESGPSTSPTTSSVSPTTTPSDQAPAPETTIPELGGGSVDSVGPAENDNTGLTVLALLVVLALLWAIVVPSLHVLQHRRRRRRIDGHVAAAGAALDDVDRVLAAWAEAEEALHRAGVRRRPSETLLEFSGRAPSSAGLQTEAATALRSLCREAANLSYAPGGAVEPATVNRAGASARQVRDAVLDQLTLSQRARWYLDPRPLWRRD